jgi:hypothetical protein
MQASIGLSHKMHSGGITAALSCVTVGFICTVTEKRSGAHLHECKMKGKMFWAEFIKPTFLFHRFLVLRTYIVFNYVISMRKVLSGIDSVYINFVRYHNNIPYSQYIYNCWLSNNIHTQCIACLEIFSIPHSIVISPSNWMLRSNILYDCIKSM